MPKRAFPIAIGALASPVIVFAPPSLAQQPASQAWTRCELREAVPAGGGQLVYQSVAGTGPAVRPSVTWRSAGTANRLRLSLSYWQGPAIRGFAFYPLGSEPQPVGYKVVFDFDGAAPEATLSLRPAAGATNLTGSFDTHSAELAAGFARARQVTATVYEGDRQIARDTFELAAIDRRTAGLDAFARRAQANDPGVCGAGSGPPLPVPPFPR